MNIGNKKEIVKLEKACDVPHVSTVLDNKVKQAKSCCVKYVDDPSGKASHKTESI